MVFPRAFTRVSKVEGSTWEDCVLGKETIFRGGLSNFFRTTSVSVENGYGSKFLARCDERVLKVSGGVKDGDFGAGVHLVGVRASVFLGLKCGD